MIPEEVLKQVRRIQILTSRMVTDVLAGQYHSVFKGRGMEFAEVRQYQFGDDIRTIDWNVTARTNVPHVREYVEERELTVMLLVDASCSLDVGTAEKTKRELATELCAVLAFSAVTNNDKVGLIVFTDEIELFVPPKKGKRHVLRVIREVLTHRPRGKGTNIKGALEHLSKVAKKRSVAFVISDFLDQGYERDLSIANRAHDLVAMSIADPTEYELGARGHAAAGRRVELKPIPAVVRLVDPETGRVLLVDGRSLKVRRDYQEAAAVQRAQKTETFRRRGIDKVELRTDEDYVRPLVAYFRERENR